MPSPIAHAISGYVLGHLPPFKSPPSTQLKIGQPQLDSSQKTSSSKLQAVFSFTALYSIAISVLPDLDFLPQALTGLKFHRGPTHSFFAALTVSLLLAWIVPRYVHWRQQRSKPSNRSHQNIFLLTFGLYSLHLLLDMVTAGGRGMQLFWPLSHQYFRAPFSLFLGVHHSRGLWDVSHLFFLTTELIYSICVVTGLWFFQSRQSAKQTSNSFSQQAFNNER